VAILSRGRRGIPTDLPDGIRHWCWDATLPGSAKAVHTEVEAWAGPVSILVNNVGGGGTMPDEYNRSDPRHWWETVLRRNVGSMQEWTDLVLPGMRDQEWGRVVTVASIYGREAGGQPWFAAAKAAEIAVNKAYSQAIKFVLRGITFNVVCPGCVQIPGTGWESGTQETMAKEETVPMCRLGEPEEVAAVVTFLCSIHASWVNGSCITVDGGEGRAF
jgi:NAD(P)-dependent dehydrogenase (short-subunit alcohol dehydrogenase family)